MILVRLILEPSNAKWGISESAFPVSKYVKHAAGWQRV